MRLRALVVAPEDNSSSISTIHGSVSTSTNAIPEIDFSYYLTSNVAVEVIAGTTQHHNTADNTALGHVWDVGSVWLLPPTVTAQYHFWTNSRFTPYIGAGVNYTFFYGASAPGNPVDRAHYDNNVGAALQIGFDSRLEKGTGTPTST